MEEEKDVLCAANAYTKKFYWNPAFFKIPEEIQDELKIMCVLFTEDVGGILELFFNEDGELEFRTLADEGDYLYDEIGSALKIKELQRSKRELFESLQAFYKTIVAYKFKEE